jgi:hypothetical protein
MQVHRQQFHHLVGTSERAIDPCPTFLYLSSFLVDLEDDQQFWLAPLALVAAFLCLFLALAFLFAANLAQANPPAIELGHDSLASQQRARRHLPSTIEFQVGPPSDKDLVTQMVGDAMNGLDVEIEATPGEFLACQRKGRKKSNLTSNQADQSGRVAIVKAKNGEFGVKTATVGRAPLARARSMVQSGNPKEQTTEQANPTAAWFSTAERTLGFGYFFWEAAEQAGAAAA